MPDDLGARLREARTKQGLSLRSVAQSIGVSASLVSQVEVGKTQPSVSTLFAMASHLGVSFDELLGSTPLVVDGQAEPQRAVVHGQAVQRAAENPVIEMEDGVRWEKLAAASDGPVDTMLVSYEPGSSSSIEGKFMRHSGLEYAYILEGELTLHLEDESHVLGPGDSLQFDSARPHLYENQGAAAVRGVWFLLSRGDAQPDVAG